MESLFSPARGAGNKTFIIVCQDEGFPMLKCSVCGNNIGKFGWAHDE